MLLSVVMSGMLLATGCSYQIRSTDALAPIESQWNKAASIQADVEADLKEKQQLIGGLLQRTLSPSLVPYPEAGARLSRLSYRVVVCRESYELLSAKRAGLYAFSRRKNSVETGGVHHREYQEGAREMKRLLRGLKAAQRAYRAEAADFDALLLANGVRQLRVDRL